MLGWKYVEVWGGGCRDARNNVWDSRSGSLTQLEVHGHRHDDRNRRSIELGRVVFPLPDSVNRRFVEQRDRPKYFDVRHPTVRTNHRLKNNDTRNSSCLGNWWINGINIPRLDRGRLVWLTTQLPATGFYCTKVWSGRKRDPAGVGETWCVRRAWRSRLRVSGCAGRDCPYTVPIRTSFLSSNPTCWC